MDFPIHSITKSPQETERIGQTLGSSYLKEKVSRSEIPRRGRSMGLPRVIFLLGELGSGKTTFVRGFARGLGLEGRLLSPTYIIVRRYSIPKLSRDSFLYHLDLYRMNTKQDAESIGIPDMLNDPESIIIIEWPDRMSGLLWESWIECRFTSMEDGKHEVTIQTIVNNKR